ncbi:MAG: hypothetical protein ABI461_10070 [Polyangiaceae bacterium]
MQKLDSAQEFARPLREPARRDSAHAEAAPGLADFGGGAFGRLAAAAARTIARLSDAQLAWAIGGVLFVLAAYPVFLVEVPPYQDLPNHLAAVTVITHPAQYPEFVANGFFKTNAALFSWLYFVGNVVGVKLAARLFALLVLGTNAVVFPQFVLRFGNRQKMLVASLFMGPMVHNWFVSMGMLDFALGVPLSLVVLMLLRTRAERPTFVNGVAICATTLCTWYAHCFAMMVVLLLVGLHVVTRATWRERFEQAKRLILPQIPAIILVSVSLLKQLTEPVGEMTGFIRLGSMLPPWELLYNLWAEYFYAFTWLSVSSFFTAVVLAIIGYRARRAPMTFFSPVGFLALAGLFLFLPYVATNWFHVNSRFIPYLWLAALVRVPEKLDRRLAALLGLASVLYFASLGVDYVRLDRDRAKFTAGMSAVPEGARLLPLIFTRKLTSENTRSLLHAWGYYVMEKQTSAPLLFAHSQSFPVMYRDPPPPRFNHLVLESFAPSMRSKNWMCDVLRSGGVAENDCQGAWKKLWREFWDDATPRFDHVLMWDPSDEARSQIPSRYKETFHEDRLYIYERIDTPTEAVIPTPRPDETHASATPNIAR